MKRVFLILSLVIFASYISSAQFKCKTSKDSLAYSLGINIARSLQQNGLDSIDPYIIVQAINDVLGSRVLSIEESQSGMILQKYFTELKQKKEKEMQAKGAANKAEGEKFLADNKTKKGIVTTTSGLQYEILKKGDGAIPKSTDKVTVHYTGTLIDGRKFDSSVDRGQPATFPVTGVIKGWVEALQLMPVGSKWKLYIPADLAYGQNPHPGGIIEPNMVLIFEVELLKIEQ